MNFPTIRIEGTIISADILDTITQGEGPGQTAENFGLTRTSKVKDEIARAWADSLDYWRIFKRKIAQIEGFGTTETRKFWIVPLLNLLGYDPTVQSNGQEIQGRNYIISHRDKGGFPIHIMGWRDKLDERRQTINGPRLSPHGLVQEYINLTEHVYALVTNGSSLRLLRDGSRLVRLSFVEFDLERMMEEEVFADFAVLYRLLHASRIPSFPDLTAESWLEIYHQETLESGSRIRDGLSRYVKEAIENFANGFLHHPSNIILREQVVTGKLSAENYSELLLRLIYRLLFLMVTEERDIIYDSEVIKHNSATKRLKSIYDKYYSLARLRRLSEHQHLTDGRRTDVWAGLLDTFRLFEDGMFGKPLDITPLGGRLFALNALGPLNNCVLDNNTFLGSLLKLSLFNHPKTGHRIRVNYASLNVEEFGSVYEGLLELDARIVFHNGTCSFEFKKGDGRGHSGSHYTPEELVQPLIKNSLDYLIAEKLLQPNREQALLSLKILDPACGSGHILLSAARRIASELAKVRTDEDQPNPSSFRQAIRDVVKNCIYGVDKNPAAVELCKVALWLESHTPGEPLGFLDHRIRCGDAIVGLTLVTDLKDGVSDDAFKNLLRDDKDTANKLLKRNREARLQRNQLGVTLSTDLIDAISEIQTGYQSLTLMPDKTSADIAAKSIEFDLLMHRSGRERLRALADAVVAPFFIPKTNQYASRILTDDSYREILRGYSGWQNPSTALAQQVSADNRFFHWFLEFPDVFQSNDSNGFDCVLGNPPFLGGSKINSAYGEDFTNNLLACYKGSKGMANMVSYFFRRAYQLIRPQGFMSLISTDKISKGETRESSLAKIADGGGSIIFAIKSVKWPGDAQVDISLITIFKGSWTSSCLLDKKEVEGISSYLDSIETGYLEQHPLTISDNVDKIYTGSKVYGEGFVLEFEESNKLIELDPRNKEVIFDYLSGDDITGNYNSSASRKVINFQNWPLRRITDSEWSSLSSIEREILLKRGVLTSPYYNGSVASDFPLCLEIVEKLVKPERVNLKGDRNAVEKYWQYQRIRQELYSKIAIYDNILVQAQTSKYIAPIFVPIHQIFSVKVVVFVFPKTFFYSLIQATLHNEWVWKYGTPMGGSRMQYSTNTCFETFPFPSRITSDQETQLERIGQEYHQYRQQLMIGMRLGLTKIYNLFHSPSLGCATPNQLLLSDKLFSKIFGRGAVQLRKHLDQGLGTELTYNEGVEGIEHLRALHAEIDRVVCGVYGWQDLDFRLAFREVDYLPESDRVRYTINPDTRKELLKRLLLLNNKIHLEEQARKNEQLGVLFEDYKTLPGRTKTSSIAKQGLDQSKIQLVLSPGIDFTNNINTSIENMKDWGANQPIYNTADAVEILRRSKLPVNDEKVRRWFKGLSKEQYEGVKGDDVRVPLQISFYGLIELVVIGTLFDGGMLLSKILKARRDLASRTHKIYPFATNNVKDNLKKAGSSLIYEFSDGPVTLDESGQYNLELIRQFFDELVFDPSGVVKQILPVNGFGKIVIDPSFGDGKAVTKNKEVPVSVISSYYEGESSIPGICKELDLDVDDVRAAINYLAN